MIPIATLLFIVLMLVGFAMSYVGGSLLGHSRDNVQRGLSFFVILCGISLAALGGYGAIGGFSS
jgi:hypothetical protein